MEGMSGSGMRRRSLRRSSGMRSCSRVLATVLALGGTVAYGSEVDEKKDWTMAGYDAVASHHNPQEDALRANTVGQLEVKWNFDNDDAGHDVGPIHASAVVKGGKIFVGASAGRFYAIDRDGTMDWFYVTRPLNPIYGSIFPTSPIGSGLPGAVGTPIVGAAVTPKNHGLVIFGDLDGNVYALDRETGAEVWVREDVDPHILGGVVGNSLLLVDDTVIIGMSSLENLGLALPFLGIPYQCCDHQGFVVALDVKTGEERWRYNTIEAAQPLPAGFAPFVKGPAGADVWGQPTYDALTRTVYIGTGQNFAPPVWKPPRLPDIVTCFVVKSRSPVCASTTWYSPLF